MIVFNPSRAPLRQIRPLHMCLPPILILHQHIRRINLRHWLMPHLSRRNRQFSLFRISSRPERQDGRSSCVSRQGTLGQIFIFDVPKRIGRFENFVSEVHLELRLFGLLPWTLLLVCSCWILFVEGRDFWDAEAREFLIRFFLDLYYGFVAVGQARYRAAYEYPFITSKFIKSPIQLRCFHLICRCHTPKIRTRRHPIQIPPRHHRRRRHQFNIRRPITSFRRLLSIFFFIFLLLLLLLLFRLFMRLRSLRRMTHILPSRRMQRVRLLCNPLMLECFFCRVPFSWILFQQMLNEIFHFRWEFSPVPLRIFYFSFTVLANDFTVVPAREA